MSWLARFLVCCLPLARARMKKVLPNILVTSEERKVYANYKNKRVVLLTHPSAGLGTDPTGVGLSPRTPERLAHIPDRARKVRPYDRGGDCLPSDFRDTPVSDVPACVHLGRGGSHTEHLRLSPGTWQYQDSFGIA